MSRVRASRYASMFCLSLVLAQTGCPGKKEAVDKGGTGKTGGGGDTVANAPLLPIGMADPFQRMSSGAAKALDRGYKALRTKKYDEAAEAFAETLTAVPDHTATRFQRARALVNAGKLPEARQELEQLLARDFIAYAGRAEKPKEWKALRDSPEWATYQSAEARYKAAYGQGLDKGFVFVARHREGKPAVFSGDEAKLDLNQEVYHYDPATSRYRRLTWTDGRVFAAMRAPDGKSLAFISATKLRRGEKGDLFVDPQAGYLDLTTLETVGPFPISGAFYEVSLGFGPGGALFATESTPGVDGGTFMVDTARTGMAKASAPPAGERTWAQVAQVWHSGKGSPAGATMAADHRSFSLEGGKQITSARELADSALEWSPSKKRITYAGKLDACKILRGGDKSKNELFVYDVDKKSAQRIDTGVSEFETLWLSDDLLAYENGIGNAGTVNLYNFPEHKKVTLTPRHGAGIYGVPSLNCQEAAAPTGEGEVEPPLPDGD